MKRLSLREFGRIVGQVIETLPDQFKPYLENLVIDIEDEPDQSTLRDQGFTNEEIAEGDTLYGLFVPFPIAGEVEFGGIDDPAAYLIHRTDLPWRTVFTTLMLVGVIIPGFLRAIAWILLLSPQIGLVNQLLRVFIPVVRAP